MIRRIKLPVRSVVWVLPFCLTGCFHKPHKTKAQQLAPPITQPAQSAQPTPQPAPAPLPPPVVTVPVPSPPATASTAPPASKPPVRRKQPNKNKEEAANVVPKVSAVGELSSGDPLGYRRKTEKLIEATEHGLDSISHPLSPSEQKTAAHIRQFLKQAKAALSSGDVDGAHTLAAKAKILLDELTE